jgi:hypothetical protein
MPCSYHLVIEVVNWCPLDLLPYVFFLFGLECKLNKYLLKLFVDVVDAKLLETVVLKEEISLHLPARRTRITSKI